jgi:hypothetical protein
LERITVPYQTTRNRRAGSLLRKLRECASQPRTRVSYHERPVDHQPIRPGRTLPSRAELAVPLADYGAPDGERESVIAQGRQTFRDSKAAPDSMLISPAVSFAALSAELKGGRVKRA